MKTTLLTLLALLGLGATATAEIKTAYVDLESFTDFSISGRSEADAQKVFDRELQRSRLPGIVGENRVLELTFTDIDMAGDIQPWRNRHNSDIRYVESIYPPRMSFRYVLRDAEGNELASGEESIRDLSFDLRVRTMSSGDPFLYELEMLTNWARRTLPEDAS
jgi:hypothetical protein